MKRDKVLALFGLNPFFIRASLQAPTDAKGVLEYVS